MKRIPFLFRRPCTEHYLCCCRDNHEAEAQRQAELIRISIENLRQLALDPGTFSRQLRTTAWSPLHEMTPDDRRQFLQNILVSKKIVRVTKETDDVLEDTKTAEHSSGRVVLFLADLMDDQVTTKQVNLEPCSICLNDYGEGEILCWSQNSSCQHCFHRDCAMEWLMENEECPLCRNNYLSLDPDGGEDDGSTEDRPADRSLQSGTGARSNTSRPRNEVIQGGASSVLRDMHLLYSLSRLQAWAGTRPNATINEDIELSGGQQRNTEIQEPPDTAAGVCPPPATFMTSRGDHR
jgi:Ring finger domain